MPLNEKNLLPYEQILSFRVDPFFKPIWEQILSFRVDPFFRRGEGFKYIPFRVDDLSDGEQIFLLEKTPFSVR